ncbi:vegetative incompatibility protein HET-E-1 [Camillea tinctor]|nr:vegetative incompatibility protein HET-E-1 [Camillea tinctor]
MCIMRLLKVEDDGSLCLTEELNRAIPPYAILSHTWGHDGQEVTFQDITNGVGQHKDGYRKIEFCRKRAIHDGLGYFWVDTCCIDKSSNTELSEAINSMFRWYKNATKCYVYLSDVQEYSTQADEPSQSTWKINFQKSRWFTRGWTLQELIAPPSVEFFSSDDKRLGDKRSLKTLLHEITGITINAIKGIPLSNFTIDERMSWSKGRETKRDEDKAYALLGIFDVHMPLIYGEGEENALERLQREIDLHSSKLVLDKLSIADGAAFDSHAEEYNSTCCEGTRIEILEEIKAWATAESPQTKAIFWLNGMAGTGKSTISRTVARYFSDRRQLGASFFFKRGEGARSELSKFFATITTQLVRQLPALVPHVKRAIKDHPDLFNKAMQEQFQKLILIPLTEAYSETQHHSSLVVVIDALDECEQQDNVGQIIGLFSRFNEPQCPRLRIFTTSRPELHIRDSFIVIEDNYQDLVLHERSVPTIEHDISIYLHHELTKIKSHYNRTVPHHRQLPQNWPNSFEVDGIIKMSIPLFIFAATTCRFLADRRGGNPDEKLSEVLKYQTKSQESNLDATYLPVLNQLLANLPRREENKVMGLFKRLVGSIIILQNPLPTSSLSRLLDISQDEIENLLDFLHSVLNIPSSPKFPVRLFHLSFRDFLLDPSKCGKIPFWIDEKEAHRQLAVDCLRLLDETLQRDICQLQWPEIRLESISRQKIDDKLPLEVQYACQYWIYHIELAEDGIYDGSEAHCFLKRHFLHWLEALIIMKKKMIIDITKTIQISMTLSQSKDSVEVLQFLEDAMDFIYEGCSTIFEEPLQIYYSVLALAPMENLVRKTFHDELPAWISFCQVNEVQSLQNAPRGHNYEVKSLVFSHDSKLVASASNDTVQVWSADTGRLRQVFQDHGYDGLCIEFSHDSRFIASGSFDHKIRLWSIETGQLQKTIESPAATITFSRDSRLMASGWFDGKIRLWPIETGQLQRTFESSAATIMFDSEHHVVRISFSHDSRLIASASVDRKIRLWSTETGQHQKTIDSEKTPVLLTFSRNSSFIASGSSDDKIRLWSTETGVLLQVFDCTTYEFDSFSNELQLYLTNVGVDSMGWNLDAIKNWVSGYNVICKVFSHVAHRHGVGIQNDQYRTWITWNGRKLIRLPDREYEYFAGPSAISGSTVVIGCNSGKMIFMRLSPELLSCVAEWPS